MPPPGQFLYQQRQADAWVFGTTRLSSRSPNVLKAFTMDFTPSQVGSYRHDRTLGRRVHNRLIIESSGC